MIKTDVPTDYICGVAQKWILVELKQPNGKFTQGQQKFLAEADRRGLDVHVWRTLEDVETTLAKSW
jgi:hypothetical protein